MRRISSRSKHGFQNGVTRNERLQEAAIHRHRESRRILDA
jgi:hypothetical protein